MAPITGGTSGIGAAFARRHSVKVLARCTIPAGSKVHRAPAPMGEAGAATLAIEMTARDDEEERRPGALCFRNRGKATGRTIHAEYAFRSRAEADYPA
jgi:hypothetical protein